MKLRALINPIGCLFIGLAIVMAAGSTESQQQQKNVQDLSAIRAKFVDVAKQPAFCTNCARLSVHICSLPGYGCPSCTDIADYLGVVAFLDPDYYIHNSGNLASNPGTLTVQWYDLVAKSNITRTVAVPAIPLGGDEIVTFVCTGILVLASEGVTLTLDYTDSAGTRHRVRKATKCPDK
jgi:hypothetical protein